MLSVPFIFILLMYYYWIMQLVKQKTVLQKYDSLKKIFYLFLIIFESIFEVLKKTILTLVALGIFSIVTAAIIYGNYLFVNWAYKSTEIKLGSFLAVIVSVFGFIVIFVPSVFLIMSLLLGLTEKEKKSEKKPDDIKQP